MEKFEIEMLAEFKKTICEHCSSYVGCRKKDDKMFLVCPKYNNFKVYGKDAVPL